MTQQAFDATAQVLLNAGFAVQTSFAYNECTITAQAADIVPLLRVLRDDVSTRYSQLIDLCGVDYPQQPQRFAVVYHLLSLHKNLRLRVCVHTDETTPVPSVIDVYPCADWLEREAFDMYGILFANHPDLRRILTDYGFEGHPLRKDFPLSGFVELRYDDELKKVAYSPVQLTQDFRQFDFESPWEGVANVYNRRGETA